MDFVIENYIWFVIIGIILIMALIGYIAEKTDFVKDQGPKESKKKKNKKNKNETEEETGVNANNETPPVEPTWEEPQIDGGSMPETQPDMSWDIMPDTSETPLVEQNNVEVAPTDATADFDFVGAPTEDTTGTDIGVEEEPPAEDTTNAFGSFNIPVAGESELGGLPEATLPIEDTEEVLDFDDVTVSEEPQIAEATFQVEDLIGAEEPAEEVKKPKKKKKKQKKEKISNDTVDTSVQDDIWKF